MTRYLADRTETQRRRGNGSVGPSADLGVSITGGCVDGVGAPAPTHSDSTVALAQRLNQLTQEVLQSRQRTEQLQAALDKRTRRVQQLLGERDRLASLLAGRDAELQRLNREFGAITARAAPEQVRSPALWTTVRKLLAGIQRARKISRPAEPAALRPHQPDVRICEKRLVPWAKQHPPKDICAVVVFGLAETEIECVLGAVERYCAEHDAAPLLLTDNDSFRMFRNRRVLFEFLPPCSEQQRVAPNLDWHLFTLRRLALIRRKWRPSRVVPFGRRAAEVVQLWRDSPFEETPLPTPFHNRSAGAELAGNPALPNVALQQ